MDVLVLGKNILVRQEAVRPSASGHLHPQTGGRLSALNRLANIAGRPTARRLHRAAHKNSDLDNESGSVATRILPPRDNAVLRADQLEGRHRQLE